MIQPDNPSPAPASGPAAIRRPGPDDYQELLDVWERSVRATHYFLNEEDMLLFCALTPQYLELLDLYCTRDAAGRISGILGVGSEKIEMLFVRPDERGRGLGRKLLHFALHELGFRRVDVNEQNESACRFYRAAGFGIAGRSATDGMGMAYPLLQLEYCTAPTL